jgi:hypothetical protein
MRKFKLVDVHGQIAILLWMFKGMLVLMCRVR